MKKSIKNVRKNKRLIDRIFNHFSLDMVIYRLLKKYGTFKYRKRKQACRIFKKAFIEIHPETSIGDNLRMPHAHNITIGLGCIIGRNVTIYHNVTIGQNHDKYPIIDDNVIIYTGSVLIGDIRIGKNCIIGAGSLVNKSFPANCIICGNPAKVIGHINEK